MKSKNRLFAVWGITFLSFLTACQYGPNSTSESSNEMKANAEVDAVSASAPSFVQQNYATPSQSVSNVSVKLQANQVAGNMNVVAIGFNDTSSAISSVSDSQGNSYSLAVPIARGSGLSQAIYYARNIKAGANTVKVVLDRKARYVDVRVAEYKGIDPVVPFVGGGSSSGSGKLASVGAINGIAANSLLFAAGMTSNGFYSAGSGFTQRVITKPDADVVEDRVASVAGNYGATAPLSSGNYVFQLAVFKSAAAVQPSPTPSATPSPTPTSTPSATPTSPASAPAISSQPQGGDYHSGQQFSVQVAATGSGNLSYQWYKDGAALPGANLYLIYSPSIQVADAGHYYVIVKNSVGQTQSNTVTVTVDGLSGPGSTPTPTPSATPSPTPSATPSATPTPTPSATPPSSGTAGLTMPVGPQANISCSGVNLSPGANIQSAVSANPNGTVFCLAAGTYAQQSIVPKTGNKFIGAYGAILDGKNSTVHAFSGSASNVTVQNLVIQNYTAGKQQAAVHYESTTGWTVMNNEIAYNAGVGVLLGDNSLTRANFIHHNLEDGYGCCGPKGIGVVLDNNEIAFNNYTDAFDPADEAGGGKFWASTGTMVTHNYVHDNHGPGLWDDNDNTEITYAYNLLERNMEGIFHEIGYNASIHDNVLRDNCDPNGYRTGWLWCGAIQIAGSGGVNGGLVEIYNNTIVGNGTGNGISLIQQNRGTGALGPYLVQNVYVHNNTIDLSKGGVSGGVEDTGSTAMFASGVNRFENNTYILGTNNRGSLWWNNNDGGKTFWQSFGLDLNGVFK